MATKKPYEFIRSTLRYRKGDVKDLDPKHHHTQQRLDRGIIKPVAPAKKRETKIVEPAEVKDASADE